MFFRQSLLLTFEAVFLYNHSSFFSIATHDVDTTINSQLTGFSKNNATGIRVIHEENLNVALHTPIPKALYPFICLINSICWLQVKPSTIFMQLQDHNCKYLKFLCIFGTYLHIFMHISTHLHIFAHIYILLHGGTL